MAHAWCINRAGIVIETTWETAGSAYYGISFSRDYLLDTLVTNKMYGLLSDYIPYKIKINYIKNGFPTGAIIE
jgi:hypothetical protein